MAYIYSITNLENNKVYVGKTTKSNPYDRWKQHLQLARSFNNLQENNSALSMPILRAISKYGADNFKFRVIEECADDNVNERETFWIEKLDACSKNGYNVTLGGEGIKKPQKYWSNHPHSKEVSCYTLEGEWIKDYESVGLAAMDITGKRKTSPIRFCIKGTTFQAFGYRWALKGEELKLIEKRVNRRGCVYGINLELGHKKIWKSVADAAEEVNGNRKNNANIKLSIDSDDNNKLSAYGWYFFRSKPVKWKAAKRNTFTTESAKKASKKSGEKTKRPVYGVNIKTGEVVEFNSMSEASFFIKGEGDYSGVANIKNNIERVKNGCSWCYAFDYRWYYKT